MRLLCSRLVAAVGDWWGYIAWGLFASLLMWYAGAIPSSLLPPLLILSVLWWVTDAMDQSVSPWVVVFGLLLTGFLWLPLGFLIVAACWILYWFKHRD